MSTGKFDYAQKLRSIQQIVEQLENGQLDFEQSLQAYELAQKTIQECENYLKDAELRFIQAGEASSQ